MYDKVIVMLQCNLYHSVTLTKKREYMYSFMSKIFWHSFFSKAFFTFLQFATIFLCEDNSFRIKASVYQAFINVIAFLQNYRHHIFFSICSH